MQEAHVRTGFLPVDLASILTVLFAAPPLFMLQTQIGAEQCDSLE